MLGLDAPHHSPGQLAGKQRVLRVILKIPAAQGVPMNIHRWGQPDRDVVLLHLRSRGRANPGHQFSVPGCSQQGRAGPSRGTDPYLGLNPQAGGAVCGGEVWHTIFREVA